jgi:hypothetical protein
MNLPTANGWLVNVVDPPSVFAYSIDSQRLLVCFLLPSAKNTPDRLRALTQVERSHDRGNFGFDREKKPKIRATEAFILFLKSSGFHSIHFTVSQNRS